MVKQFFFSQACSEEGYADDDWEDGEDAEEQRQQKEQQQQQQDELLQSSMELQQQAMLLERGLVQLQLLVESSRAQL
jgi:hypothetical protein